MSPIAHLVRQTLPVRLLQAVQPPNPEKADHAKAYIGRIGPRIQALRDEGLAYVQIADQLNISRSSASVYLPRYLKAKREGLL